jgi:hypothetical protein
MMNDPHVEWLKYRVETAPHLSYGKPPPVTGDTLEFKYRLERDASQDVLTLEMKAHYASEGDACEAVRPFLEDWEVSAALGGKLDQLKFRLAGSHVIDLAPADGVHHARLGAGIGLALKGVAEAAVVMNAYPPPPGRFRYSPDVAVMWNRFANYRKGTEPLLSVAYFCYSYVCLRGGTRAAAAAKYNVEEALLKQLSTLAATGGDWSEARKAEKDSTATPLTPKEKEWLEQALKLLIERIAAYDADPVVPLSPITLADLQTL